jgi:ribosome production factor 1
MVRNPSKIGNKAKRAVVYAKYKMEKKKTKKILRAERIKETEALGDKAPPKQVPNTLENMREIDETTVKADDQEIIGDEKDDEFAAYYSNEKKPKIMITTRPKPSRKLFPFIGDLMQMIPQSFYYPRERCDIVSIPIMSLKLSLASSGSIFEAHFELKLIVLNSK